MKKVKFWYPIAAVLFGMSVSVLASYPAIKNIKEERAQTKEDVIKLDKALREALVKNDLEAVENLISDDFEIYTISHGVLNKEQWLEEIRTGQMNYTQFTNKETVLFQGKQISNIVEVSGNFWGTQADNYPIEMSIRAVEYKDKQQRIKCMTVKPVS